MRVPKAVSYPVSILSLIGLIVFAVYGLLNSIGSRMHPPQPDFQFEPKISAATVWLSEDGKTWAVHVGGPYRIFETKSEESKEAAEPLETLQEEAFGEVLFLIVRESLSKEKAKSLLGALSKFSLKKVYVASPFDDALSFLKDLEPRFWYAPSPRSWVKWSLFNTFGIEKAFGLNADFLFVDQKISKLVTKKIEEEIKRRNLPLVKIDENNRLVFN